MAFGGVRGRVGRLDQRVKIQSQTNAADGYGGFTVTWADVDTVWAKVEPIRGIENLESGRLQGEQKYRVTIRNRAVTTANRLLWTTNGDAVMQIREVHDPGARAMYLELICETGVAT